MRQSTKSLHIAAGDAAQIFCLIELSFHTDERFRVQLSHEAAINHRRRLTDKHGMEDAICFRQRQTEENLYRFL